MFGWRPRCGYYIYASTLLAVSLCTSSASAQRRREWAVSASPQLGYVWASKHFEGTLREPGQLTEIAADGTVTCATWGFAAGLTYRFWSADGETALGPILTISAAGGDGDSTRLTMNGERQQAAARSLEPQLHTRLERFGIQGGVGLAMLEGLLETRLLLGGESVTLIAPELDAQDDTAIPAFVATLGARVRLPLAERWVALVGAQCGYSKYGGMPDGLTTCAGELGLEWVIER